MKVESLARTTQAQRSLLSLVTSWWKTGVPVLEVWWPHSAGWRRDQRDLTVLDHAITVEICLSVRLSVKRVHRDNEIIFCLHSYTIRKVDSSSFRHEEWFVGTPPSTWNFGPNWPRRSKKLTDKMGLQEIQANTSTSRTPERCVHDKDEALYKFTFILPYLTS